MDTRTARNHRERRRRRRLTATAATVYSPTLVARLVDFSREGFSLETTQALRLGVRHRFRIEREAAQDAPSLADRRARSFVGVVRWCRLRATRPLGDGDVEPVFRAGLSLVPEVVKDD